MGERELEERGEEGWRGRSATNAATAPESRRGVASYASKLRERDVLGARSLRALSGLEGHRLVLAQGVERDARARGLMEEVLGAVRRCDETETLVTYQPLDYAGH